MGRMQYYILDGHTPVSSPGDSAAEALLASADRRRVAMTEFPGGTTVSTVFLVIDHGFGCAPLPVLFETLVFDGPMDGHQDRYYTWAEAEAGHARIVARVAALLGETK